MLAETASEGDAVMIEQQAPNSPLCDAMLALHVELSALELDIGAASRNPRLVKIVERWEKQRASVAQFFDWDVYHSAMVQWEAA